MTLTGTVKFSQLPYMTPAERGEFRRLRADATVTVFGVDLCGAKTCNHEVPRGVKVYCSEKCWREEEGPTDDEKEETRAMDG